ncbi:hypothetical protein GLYMA_07G220450v4 [Glycine max]|nr:hypothetical protein GLYMA_07G220450v4 [Glycine max]KAH1088039.1 hypothetical protein GYH30_019209 [Glycine max]
MYFISSKSFDFEKASFSLLTMLTWMRPCLRLAMSRAFIPAQKRRCQPPFIIFIN